MVSNVSWDAEFFWGELKNILNTHNVKPLNPTDINLASV